MKKLLSLFVILDLVFVGLVLKITSEKKRSIAGSVQETELTTGQQQKLELIRSMTLTRTSEEIIIKTDMLQSVCASYVTITLKFKALNIAFSGQEPLISHTFSCIEINKNTLQNSLSTTIEDFKSLRTTSVIKKEISELKALGIYSDEELPDDWKLFEIFITGETSFNIFEFEFNKALGEDVLKFKLSTF